MELNNSEVDISSKEFLAKIFNSPEYTNALGSIITPYLPDVKNEEKEQVKENDYELQTM